MIAMQNVGTMSKKDLESIIKQFPSNAKIERSDLLIKVIAPNSTVVLQAAILNKNTWHVRAMPGLIKKAQA